MSDSSDRSESKRATLIGILTLAAVAELLLNRVFARLVLRDVVAPAWLTQLVSLGGLASFYFASVLAVGVAAVGLWRLIFRSGLLPRAARGPALAPAVVFLLLAIPGTVIGLRGALRIDLLGSFATLVTLVVLVTSLAQLPGKTRLALGMLTVPVVLHFVAGFAEVTRSERIVAESWRISGQWAAFALGPVLLLGLGRWSRPWRGRMRAAAAGALVAAGGGWLLALDDWGLVARLFADVLAVELPLSPAGMAACAVAGGMWIWVIVERALDDGPAQLVGRGLLLIALTGYQLEAAGQLATALVGLLCVADGLTRRPASERTQWRALVEQTRKALGVEAIRFYGVPGSEQAELQAERHGVPITVQLGQQQDVPYLEVICGDVPAHEPAPLSLTRRGSARMGRARGDVVETGDAAFDACFRLRDARVLDGPDGILTDSVRRTLGELMEGWLGVWPGRGACCRVADSLLIKTITAGGEQAAARFAALLDVLAQICRSR